MKPFVYLVFIHLPKGKQSDRAYYNAQSLGLNYFTLMIFLFLYSV